MMMRSCLKKMLPKTNAKMAGDTDTAEEDLRVYPLEKPLRN
jgi:RecA-family ATPase